MFAEINKEAVKLLPFTLQTVGESRKQSAINRPEGHPYHHLIWVTSGSGAFELGGRTFILEKGEGMFMRAHIPHSYSGDNFSTMWFTFSMDNTALDYMGAGDFFRFNTPENLSSEALHLLEFANGNSNTVSRSAAGYTFITEFFAKALSETVDFSERVIEILERRYSEPISLDDIAEELSTDKYTLCRRYKAEKGKTVMDELFRIRISKAKRFLRMSEENVADIGRMCGFENSCYFIKRFREYVGCTPSSYRRSN